MSLDKYELWEQMTPSQRKIATLLTGEKGHCNCPVWECNGVLCPPCEERGYGQYLGDAKWEDDPEVIAMEKNHVIP